MTYYDILEISESASEEVVRMAYKALVKKYHPDVYQGDPKEAEEKTQQINSAYEVLSDSQKRKEYDEYLRQKRHNTQATAEEQTAQTAPSADSIKKEFEFPSGRKSGWIIGVLLFVCFSLSLRPYIESGSYEYAAAGLLGFADFCLRNIILLAVPMFVGILKTDITPKGIKKLCNINSLSLYFISLFLKRSEILSMLFIGLPEAILYYFISKHILLQIKKHSCNKKKSLIIIGIAIAVSITTIVCITKFVFDLNDTPYQKVYNFDDSYEPSSNYTEYTEPNVSPSKSSCLAAGCDNGQNDSGFYCSEHKCADEFCTSKKSAFSDYCLLHDNDY